MNIASKTQSTESDQSTVGKRPSMRYRKPNRGSLGSTYGSYGRYYGGRYYGSRYYGSRYYGSNGGFYGSSHRIYGRMSVRGPGYRMYR